MVPRFLALFFLLMLGSSVGAADVLSFHNNQQSTGQNLAETKLTPSSVNVAGFRRRFVLPVDGQVYAQPLYKANVSISSGPYAGVHNVVIVATQHATVYAVDSLSGAILWQTSLLTAGIPGATQITTVTSADVGSTDIEPEIGIVSTPVIDPASGHIFVTAKTKQIVALDPTLPRYVYTLFKLTLDAGAIAQSTIIGVTFKPADYEYRTDPDPSAPQDPFVFGTGHGAQVINGTSRVYFNAQRQMNRPGLLLHGGRVYIAFGSHSDNGPYHGWLLSYDAATLTLASVLNCTPNGGLGGVWQSGGIPVVDAQGFIYFNTGNGTFDGNKGPNNTTIGLNAQGMPLFGNYGNCFLKVAQDPTTSPANQNINGWGLKIVDYFCPYNTQSLNTTDSDLGSGGPVVLPNEVGSAAHPHLLIGAGKEGKIYLLDRDNLGKFDAVTDHVVQTQGSAINGCVNTPAYFNGQILWVGGYYDYARLYDIGGGSMAATPSSQAVRGFSFPGATPSISANGLNNGIAWVLERSSNELRAYNANDLTEELWTSARAPGNRDQLGTVVKFTVPTVADGLVFVGTMDSLVVYGPPVPPQSAPAAPTSLSAMAASGIEVVLSWTDRATNEDGFKVEQSADGVNFAEIATLGVNENRIAVHGLQPSTFYYFRVRAFNAFGDGTFSEYSNVAGVATQSQPPSINFAEGFLGTTTSIRLLGSALLTEDGAVQLTDGSAAQVGALWSRTLRNSARWTTQFSFQLSGASEGFTFCLQNAAAGAIGSGGPGLGYAGIKKSVAVKFDVAPNISATGVYVSGGTPEEISRSIDLAPAGIDLQSGHVFSVLLTYNKGVLTQTIIDTETSASFTQQYTINIPKLLGSSTAYLGFTAADGTSGATQRLLSWTYAAIPAAPTTAPSNVRVKVASGTQLNVFWKDNSKGEAGYIIQRRTPPATKYATVGVVGPNVTAFMDTALTPLQPYYYIVRATNAAGLSAPTTPVLGKTPVPPLTPSNARATSVTPTKIALAWKDNAGNETKYAILRKDGEDGEFKFLNADLAPNSKVFVDRTVLPGTTYDYHIQCRNAAGYSDFAGLTVTTPPSAP